MLETSLAVEYASQVVTLMATANIHDSSSGVIADLFHRADVPGGTHPLADMFGQNISTSEFVPPGFKIQDSLHCPFGMAYTQNSR